MAAHNELGKWGEDLAASYLEKQGYEILERDWKSGHHDLDIVARDENTLVIVEVKTRKSGDYGEPEIAVGRYKQRMLIWAADAYVRYKNLDVDVRFDIISVVITDSEPEIEHIEDAFIVTGY